VTQRNATLGQAQSSGQEVPLRAIIAPYVRRKRTVLGACVLAWAIALAVAFIPARRYTASVVLAAVPNARTSALTGGLTAILGSAQLGGVQSTPYFIAKLLLLRSVITQVANEPVPDSRGGTVIERVLEERAADIKPTAVEPAMRDVVSAEVDKQTGLIGLRATHTDSAVVRRIANRLVETASATFIRVSKAQASSQRSAQAERVDSARRQLRRAEERALNFISANRAFTPFSPASISRQQVEREVTNAQTVYSQARTDYEAAVARELEETPAVVVVDSIPARLLPDPLHVPLKLVLATTVALLAVTALFWATGEWRPQRATGDEPSARAPPRAHADDVSRQRAPIAASSAAAGRDGWGAQSGRS
jgi:uncharacterized protein involved in exopolysaccharide biosynthesis